MAIKVGDKIPDVELQVATAGGIEKAKTSELFGGKKTVLFAVPGAFTPTCSAKHLPGFVGNADALREKGIEAIVCVAVNDVFVMDAWGKNQDVGERVMMAADGSAALTKALGLESDMSAKGFGLRCQRFSMVVEDGTVKSLNIDAPGTYENTSAEMMLGSL